MEVGLWPRKKDTPSEATAKSEEPKRQRVKQGEAIPAETGWVKTKVEFGSTGEIGPRVADIITRRRHRVLPQGFVGTFAVSKSSREEELEDDIADLKRKVTEQQRALEQEIAIGQAKEESLQRLKATIEALQQRERKSFVLNRIHDEAREVFLGSPEFEKAFLESRRCEAFVMAVDVRRSTELMLKSRSPEDFAHFITTLSNILRNIVLEHHGVFDKFTGDGVLAFFPDFYTGDDAGYYVLAATEKCHRAFTDHYRKNLTSFYTVLSLKEVGLGIGIDYGQLGLVRVGQELEIVGNPVVYACRMAGTRPGNTLLNQAAYQKIAQRFSMYCLMAEDKLDVKHEGEHIAYSVRLNDQPYTPGDPAWRKFAKGATAEA